MIKLKYWIISGLPYVSYLLSVIGDQGYWLKWLQVGNADLKMVYVSTLILCLLCLFPKLGKVWLCGMYMSITMNAYEVLNVFVLKYEFVGWNTFVIAAINSLCCIKFVLLRNDNRKW